MQFDKKGLHELMSPLGELSANCSEHLIPNLGHFNLKFPIGCIFGGIGRSVCRINFRIMEPSSDLSSKEKSPAYADSTDGVQLVRIKDNFCFQSGGRGVATKAMRSDAVTDRCPVRYGIAQIQKERFRHFRPLFSMTNFSLATAFLIAANIMKQGCWSDDVKLSVHLTANCHS